MKIQSWQDAIAAAEYLDRVKFLCNCGTKVEVETFEGRWCVECASKRYHIDKFKLVGDENDFRNYLYRSWREFLSTGLDRERGTACIRGVVTAESSSGQPQELHSSDVGTVICTVCKVWPCRCYEGSVPEGGTKVSGETMAGLLGSE